MEAVHRLNILDTKPDPRLDALTKEATEKLRLPISTISILDNEREWYKSCQGILDTEDQRDNAFCSWALLSSDVFIVEDTLLDDRFKSNPHVIGAPFIRFYAGCAITDTKSSLPIGVFCVKDTKPRSLSLEEIGTLFDLTQKAENIINDLA